MLSRHCVVGVQRRPGVSTTAWTFVYAASSATVTRYHWAPGTLGQVTVGKSRQSPSLQTSLDAAGRSGVGRSWKYGAGVGRAKRWVNEADADQAPFSTSFEGSQEPDAPPAPWLADGLAVADGVAVADALGLPDGLADADGEALGEGRGAPTGADESTGFGATGQAEVSSSPAFAGGWELMPSSRTGVVSTTGVPSTTWSRARTRQCSGVPAPSSEKVQLPGESARAEACPLNGVTEVLVVKQDSVPTPLWVWNGASKYGLELTCSWYSDAVGTGVHRKVGTPAAGSTRPPTGLRSWARWPSPA